VTAFDEYAVSAFDAAAVDYLLKPVSDARLAQCILKLQQGSTRGGDIATLLEKLRESKPSYLNWLHTGVANTTRVLAVGDVVYFRASDKYVDVITATEKHLIRTSLKELAVQLDPDQFAQIHRSVIVNLGCVERLERDVFGRLRLHLKGHKDVLPVSRANAQRFRQM
jgi:DNA-binding LytR/AlgR family response regulator